MLRLILRHAWLNLWDKHMTAGRINQVCSQPKMFGKARQQRIAVGVRQWLVGCVATLCSRVPSWYMCEMHRRSWTVNRIELAVSTFYRSKLKAYPFANCYAQFRAIFLHSQQGIMTQPYSKPHKYSFRQPSIRCNRLKEERMNAQCYPNKNPCSCKAVTDTFQKMRKASGCTLRRLFVTLVLFAHVILIVC